MNNLRRLRMAGQLPFTEPPMWLRRISLAVFAVLAVSGESARAAEGIPEWSRVLDTVLKRAEEEVARGRHDSAVPDESAAQPVVHPAVSEFVRYYQTTGAGTWANSMRRLSGIRPMVEQVFREEGVPPELLWLGLVESGYRASVRSPKNAAGVWQFVPETARRFGLVVDARQDERADTVKATRAAAKYLAFLFDMFGDWNLALAAYNAGEGRVQSAIDRGGTRDFWALAAGGRLPRETAAYVPAVLAAQMLGTGQMRIAELKPRTVEAPFSLSP